MRVEHTYYGMPKRLQPHERQAVELKQSETVIGMEYQKKINEEYYFPIKDV